MKLKKIENYDAGYSKEDLLKKFAAGALGAAMLGSLAGCELFGVRNEPIELDGDQILVTESDCVSDGNLSYDGKVSTASSDDGEKFELDGDIYYAPEDVDSE